MNKKFKETEIGWIPEEWDLKSLGDLSEIKGGKRLTKGHTLVEYKTNHPYIRVTDLIDFGVNTDDILYLREETFEKIRNYTINSNDVYISIVGTVGLVGLIPKKLNGANLTENCAKITNINEIKKEFLAFFLKSRFGQEQIKMLTVGSTQGKLALSRIKKIKIPIPPLEEQIEICNLLYSLTNKIEINQKINQTLEEIGQAIFKQLVVHFEFPNNEGKPYKSNGGEMVDSELGKIPKSWEVVKVGDLIELVYGKGLTKTNRIPGEIPVYGSNGITDYHNESFVKGPGLIIGRKGTVGKIHISYSNFWPIDTTYFVKSKIDSIMIFWYYLLTSLNLENMNVHSAVPGLNRNDVYEILVVKPEEKILFDIEILLKSLFDKINQNKIENQNLKDIRDSLLPKLMSGKIRVPLEDK